MINCTTKEVLDFKELTKELLDDFFFFFFPFSFFLFLSLFSPLLSLFPCLVTFTDTL